MKEHLIKPPCFNREVPQTCGHPFLSQGEIGTGLLCLTEFKWTWMG